MLYPYGNWVSSRAANVGYYECLSYALLCRSSGLRLVFSRLFTRRGPKPGLFDVHTGDEGGIGFFSSIAAVAFYALGTGIPHRTVSPPTTDTGRAGSLNHLAVCILLLRGKSGTQFQLVYRILDIGVVEATLLARFAVHTWQTMAGGRFVVMKLAAGRCKNGVQAIIGRNRGLNRHSYK